MKGVSMGMQDNAVWIHNWIVREQQQIAFRLRTDASQVDSWALIYFIVSGSCTNMKPCIMWIRATSEENHIFPAASEWASAVKAGDWQTDLHPKCCKAHCQSSHPIYRGVQGLLSTFLEYQNIITYSNISSYLHFTLSSHHREWFSWIYQCKQ